MNFWRGRPCPQEVNLAVNRNARFHAVQILTQFDRTNRRLSDIFSDYFASTEVPRGIRPSVTHLVQESMRWRGYLDSLLSKLYHGRFHKTEYFLRNILRLGAYEILFREHVPDYAAVSEAVRLTQTVLGHRAVGAVNAVLRRIRATDRPDSSNLQSDEPLERIAAVTSHPPWMIDRWLRHFGFEKTLKLCGWDNRLPVPSVRRNRTKVGRSEFESFLDKLDIVWETNSILSEFYHVDRIAALRATGEFDKGYYSIQDISAGLVTRLINIDKGSVILDVCAAPGGKTTYLAERLGNKGTIYAYDSDDGRLSLLKENMERLGLDSVQVGLRDATVDEYPMAKTVLLDVPCMGTGVMSKRADLRWRRTENEIEQMTGLQLKMLSHMSPFVETGGCLVYATCSVEPEENWGVVDRFLEKNVDFTVRQPGDLLKPFADERGALHTFPPDNGMDGVFAVVLDRIK